ncbi:MAG: hypothetical protein V4654_02710 [Bdellovibrionota bacterium]
MKQLVVTFLIFASFNVFADEIVSQPADCHIKETLPCTVKSMTRHKAVIKQTSFVFLKNAVVKITDFANFNLEPVVGGFIVLGAKSSVSVKGVSLTKFPSYADSTKGQVEVIDGKDFYIYKFSEGETERYLLDRAPFIKKLAGFYNNVDALKAEYKNISPIYSKSFKQDVAVHKQILTRRIASVEEQKKQETERARRIREQQRKNKETFFKRTFVQ